MSQNVVPLAFALFFLLLFTVFRIRARVGVKNTTRKHEGGKLLKRSLKGVKWAENQTQLVNLVTYAKWVLFSFQ